MQAAARCSAETAAVMAHGAAQDRPWPAAGSRRASDPALMLLKPLLVAYVFYILKAQPGITGELRPAAKTIGPLTM